ncbi:MAG: IPT/TIG domain-containing protein, partial [Alloacidobacterium sp.]
ANGFSNAAALSLSADESLIGTGIIWASRSISATPTGPPVAGVVSAYDATNLTTELWNSTQNLARDDVGNYAKFNPPTVANGKVYVGSFSGQLQVYGLNPPPASGVRFVQVASATPQSSSSTVSVSYPGAQTAGDLNVVVVGWNDSTSSVLSITDSAGNSYALAAAPTKGTALTQSIYYAKSIVGANSNTVTVTFNQAASLPDVRILEYSGVSSSSPLDVSAGASGNSYVADSGAATTTAADELIIGANTVQSNKTVDPGAPFTSRVITASDSDIAEDRVVNVPGSYHSWAPLNASGAWVMQVVTFRAVAQSAVPFVTSVSPSSGAVAGGTAVTITGTNFAAGATVTFGSTAATSVVVVNSTTITATTPAGSSGAATVTVTNSGGQSGSLANGFTYIGQPTVTSVSPNNGPVAGGTAVTITGTNFATGATVTFGSAAATSVVVVNSTTITAKTPAGSAGAVTVTVTNSGGLSGNLASGFTYNASVAISFAQVASATPQSSTASVSVTYPAAQTSGDMNVVVVGWNDTTATVQSVKDSAGNTYKLAIGPTVGTALQQSIYYAADIVSGGNTVTVTFSAAAAFPDVRILEYRGVTAVDVTAGTSGNSASASSGAATT